LHIGQVSVKIKRAESILGV